MDRYDRQLRLWGSEGQELLSSSHFCLVGPETTLIQECFKNLALLGVSKYTWLRRDTPEISNNLFYNDLAADLQPLNPAGVDIRVLPLLDEDQTLRSDFWRQFSIIMIVSETGLPQTVLDSMEQSCVPVIPMYSSGLCGYVYLRTAEPHFVIDSHPDYQVPLLHLDKPWPELSQFMNSLRFGELDEYEYAELPYAVLLYHVLQQLQQEGTAVTTQSVKETLDKWYIGKINPRGSHDLNYDEAVRFAHLCGADSGSKRLVGELVAGLGDTSPYNRYDSEISRMIRALDKYVSRHGDLMVSAKLPDMASSTAMYTALQEVYRRQALHDREEYTRILHEDTAEITPIDPSRIAAFCRDVRNVCVSPPAQTSLGQFFQGKLARNSSPALQDLIGWQQGRTPSSQELASALALPASYPTTSFIAGLACQEAVKLVTHQYTPLRNLALYNGSTRTPLDTLEA